MTTQTYTVTVSYNKSVEDLIKLGKYDWANDKINSTNFPSTDKGVKELEITLIGYKDRHSSKFVLKNMKRNGYRPATLKELLALGEQYPDLQRKDWIVALGSQWRNSHGDMCVPYLYRNGYRHLNLYWFGGDWDPYWCFAAVKLDTESIKKEWGEELDGLQTLTHHVFENIGEPRQYDVVWIKKEDARKLLTLARREGVKECLEEAKDIVKVGIQHGILPIPNPYGDMVRIKRHNQVMVECKDIAISILDQALSIVNNKK